MNTYILLGDPHLVKDNLKIYGQNPVQRLNSIIDILNEDYKHATAVFILGDLVENGDKEEYEIAKKLINKINLPVFSVPGNHDNNHLLSKVFPQFNLDENGHFQFHITFGKNNFIGIDTVCQGSSKGELCHDRLTWLDKALNAAENMVVLLMHHPVLAVGYNIDSIRLKSSKELLDILNQHKSKIRLLVFGHIHRNVAGTWEGFPFVSLKGTGHQRIRPQKGNEDVIYHGIPSYAVLNILENNIAVQFHDIKVDRAP